MKWTSDRTDIIIYFHLVAPDDPLKLLLLAGRGDIHDLPTVAMPYWFFCFIMDTLRWIPTQRAPMERVPMERAVIASEGAAIARKIFAGWSQIFSTANEEVVLTAGSGFPPPKICVSRDELVSCMSQLEAFTHEIENGEKVIYCSDTPDYRKNVNGDVQYQTSVQAAIS